jgi:N utilization substance protein B
VAGRRQAREHALQILFQIDMTSDPAGEVIERHWSGREAPPDLRAFSDRLVLGAVAAAARIDELMSAASENWRLERMATVDRNVLRIAIYELLHESQTPAAVSINEAIEVAKRFGGEESAHFVNGVLDAVRKKIADPARA